MNCGSSPADYLYGSGLQIPGEFILPSEETTDRNKFLMDFKEHIASVRPAPVRHNDKRKVFVHEKLSNCSHVFLRVVGVKKPLQRLYNGSYKVISRVGDRLLEIEVKGKSKHVSIENVKAAHFLPDQNTKKPSKILSPSNVHAETDIIPRERVEGSARNSNSTENSKVIENLTQISNSRSFAGPMEDAPADLPGSDLNSTENNLTRTKIPRGIKNVDVPLHKRTKFIPSILRKRKPYKSEKDEGDKMRVVDTVNFSNLLPEKNVSEKRQKYVSAILRRGAKRVTFRIDSRTRY